MTEGKSNVKTIKEYFESGPWGRKVDLKELKALNPQERASLGAMCQEALEKGWK